MASKKLKVSVGLDFTSDQMSIEKIRKQIDGAVSAVKINLDPQSAKKFETELRELGGLLEKHLNQNTGKINAKSLVADLDNRENFLMIEKLGQRYAEVGVNGQQSFRKVANEADFLNKKIGSSNKSLEKMGTTLMNTIRWNISSSAVNAVTGEFQKMYYFAKDLDRTLTDIRIVSGQSADQMERFALSANESAKALRVSTIEYGQAATLFFQQGLGEVDVRKMTDGAVMASRITGVAASDMADLLTSTMNGYKLAADEVITVTDKLAAVGATTASDFHELATGMSKVASMANTAGVSIDELNAQIATIVSVTRESPESIGTSLKTIYGRMLMFKTDTKALMEDDDGEVFGAPKVEEALQAYNRVAGSQISLFKTTGDGKRELRDLGEVIEEVGNSWDTVTDKTAKFGLATALAGSRQQNRLVALFDSWDMYKDAVETSLNAEGTTLEQNAIYMESYEGKVKGLQAAKEEMYMVLTDSDSMKFFVGALTEGVQLFTKLADMAGGFSAVLGIIGVAFSDNLVKKAYEFQQAFTMPKEMKETGKDNEPIESLKELHTISKAFGEDEANRYREDLRNKKAVLKEMTVEKHLLEQKVTLLEDIAEEAEGDDSEAKKKALIDSLIAEADANGVAVEGAEELRVKYNELAEAQQNLIELKELSKGEVIGDKIHQDVEDAKAVVDGLESQIKSIHKKAVEAAKRGKEAHEDVKGQLGETSAKIAAKAKEAERLAIATQATRAAFMLLPAAIGGATDSSKSLNEVIINIAKLSIPSIVVALKPVIASLVAAKGAAVGLNAAMFLPLAPIAAVAAAAIALAAIIKTVKENSRDAADAFEDMSVAAQELSNVEEGYNKVADSLELIKDRIKEIKKLQEGPLVAGETDELEEELEQLEIKKRLAEEEMIVQQFLLDTAKEKAELAAIETAEAKMKSEYVTEEDGFLMRGNAGRQGSEVKIHEELELSTIAYQENTKAVKDYKNSLADLNNTTAETAEEELDLESQKAQLLQTIRETEAAQDSARDNMSKYLPQVRENIANLDEEDEAQKALIDTRQKSVDMALKIMATDIGYHYDKVTGAVEEYGKKTSNTKDELEELTKEFENASDKINSYQGILDELNSKEGLSAKSKQDIVTKHQELLPYLHDEQELRQQLIKIIEDEGIVQNQVYMQMVKDSRKFYNKKIKGNAELVNKVKEYYGVDLDNYETLAEAKLAIEEQLLTKLTTAWSRYYNAQTDSLTYDYVELQRLGKYDTNAKILADAIYNELVDVNKKRNAFDGMVFDFAGVDFKGIGDSKAGGSKSAKDDRKFLESLDAEIRAIKIKNDHLLKTEQSLKEQLKLAKDIEGIEGLNEQYRITGEIIAHNETMLQSFKNEQDLIHARANTIRAENSKYSNTDSWFDANAEQSIAYIELHRKGTKAQQDEMDTLFGQIQKLKKAWMESAKEVNNIVDANKDLVATQNDLIAQQKELARQNYIKKMNDAYEEQQKRLSALESIQERIVAIIRKRGEEEKKALDEAYNKDIEQLEERHNKRKEVWAEELDLFKKMIQDKIDALDEQYEEEDYLEQLNKEREEANRLQSEIDVLSLDDSLTARNKTIELRKQLATQNEKIAKLQQDNERKLLKKSLEDQLKNREDQNKEIEDIADDQYKNDKKRLEEDYEINKKYLERKYSDEKIYSEARQAILDGEVEVAKGRFVELEDAFHDFEDEFGKGMGILGDIIKDEFSAKLKDAQDLLKETANLSKKLLTEVDSDTKFSDEEIGYKPPKNKEKDTDGNKGSSGGITMSSSDFNKYLNYKLIYDMAKDAGNKASMDAAKEGAQAIRDKYGISGDKYSYDDLKNKSYKDVKFKHGGKLTQTGTIIADVHGTKSTPEWIFNDAQLKEILKSTVKSAMSFDLPKIPSFVNSGNSGNQYAITFDVRGNMDRSILPEVQRMINSTIETIEFQKVKDLNKIGQFRPVK